MRARPFLFPVLVVFAATLFTWRPWVANGVDDVMLWGAVTSLTHDGDTDVTDDLMHASNPADLTHELICATWPTGAKLNPYPVGFAALWAPVEAVSHAVLVSGLDEPRPRFHPRVRAVVSLVALVLAVISVRLFFAVAARGGAGLWPAALAAGVMFVGSPVVMFSTRWPTMTHQLSALIVAAHLWCLLRWRAGREPRWAAAAGFMAGLMILVRWQNALFLVVALVLLVQVRVSRGREKRQPHIATGVCLFAAVCAVACSLQPLVWKLTSGHWFLIPQGEEYLVTDSAHLAILLCGYHGLFTAHPTYLVALIGLALMLRRDPWLAGSLLVAFAMLAHVNQMAWDWWGAGAFGQRRFASFAALAALGLAEVLRRARWPWLRGALVVLLLLWSLVYIRLYDIPGGDDLTLLLTGHPANTPRIGTPPVDPTELREKFVEIFTELDDGLLHPQLFASLDRHRWPLGAIMGVLMLAGIILVGWALCHGLRPGALLRSRRLLWLMTVVGVLWIVAIEVRLIVDDRDWRDHALTWREAALASVNEDHARAEVLASEIPPSAPQWAAAQFLIAHSMKEAGRREQAVAMLVELLGEDTPHRYPPIGGLPVARVSGLLQEIDEQAWLAWSRRTRDEGIR